MELLISDRFTIVLEGVTMNLKQCFDAIIHEDPTERKIVISDGVVQSPFSLQLVADIFGRTLYVSEVQHSSIMEAIKIGLSVMAATDEITTMNHINDITLNRGNYEICENRFARYISYYNKEKH
jgi:gluconokinase